MLNFYSFILLCLILLSSCSVSQRLSDKGTQSFSNYKLLEKFDDGLKIISICYNKPEKTIASYNRYVDGLQQYYRWKQEFLSDYGSEEWRFFRQKVIEKIGDPNGDQLKLHMLDISTVNDPSKYPVPVE